MTTAPITKDDVLYSMNSNTALLFRIHSVVADCSDDASDDATTIVYAHYHSAVPQFSRPAAEFYMEFTEVKK